MITQLEAVEISAAVSEMIEEIGGDVIEAAVFDERVIILVDDGINCWTATYIRPHHSKRLSRFSLDVFCTSLDTLGGPLH